MSGPDIASEANSLRTRHRAGEDLNPEIQYKQPPSQYNLYLALHTPLALLATLLCHISTGHRLGILPSHLSASAMSGTDVAMLVPGWGGFAGRDYQA
eukprot:1765941-Rhodomonas_salina.2